MYILGRCCTAELSPIPEGKRFIWLIEEEIGKSKGVTTTLFFWLLLPHGRTQNGNEDLQKKCSGGENSFLYSTGSRGD